MKVIPEADVRLSARLPFGGHGAVELPDVRVESYSLTIRDKGRFVGDTVNKDAFFARLDELRREAARKGKDPLGKVATDQLDKSAIAAIFDGKDTVARKIVRAAIVDFAEALVDLIEKYREADKGWRRVRGIAVGGGFSEGPIGRRVVSRARKRLRAQSIDCRIDRIRLDPDVAGMIGAAYLAPAWIFAGFDGLLGVDVGGTNIRCGTIRTHMSGSRRFSGIEIEFAKAWRHADDEPNRKEAITELIEMLQCVVRKSRKAGCALAPFIGVGCPGRIRPDGTIDRGAQNLPGKWESEHFNLPALLKEHVPIAKGHDTIVVMHNDAVVQGISQIPHMGKFADWGILTIGTGLGNARFAAAERPRQKE